MCGTAFYSGKWFVLIVVNILAYVFRSRQIPVIVAAMSSLVKGKQKTAGLSGCTGLEGERNTKEAGSESCKDIGSSMSGA